MKALKAIRGTAPRHERPMAPLSILAISLGLWWLLFMIVPKLELSIAIAASTCMITHSDEFRCAVSPQGSVIIMESKTYLSMK